MNLKSINFREWTKEVFESVPLLQERVAMAVGCDMDMAFDGLCETIKFMTLIDNSKISLTPPKNLDLVWHEFILFTKAYSSFCQSKYDRFVHHTPGGTDEENESQYSNSIKYYSLYIDHPPEEWWGISTNAQCGGCKSELETENEMAIA